MADEDKLKVSSNPPEPTDDIDEDWGSSGTAAPAPEKKAEAKPEKEETAKKSSDKAPATSKKASRRDEEEDEDEDDDDDDDDEDDDEGDDDGDDDDDDDDEDEDEDEDDDDDDDEEERRDARSRRKSAAQGAGSSFDDLIPDWLPWATLGGLLLFGFLGGIGAIPIDCNLKPAVASATPPVTSAAPTQAAAPTRPSPSARQRPTRPDDGEMVAASHLLVSYKGALRAQPTVTRTKEEAQKRAKEALTKAKKGQEFEKLVAEYSDEPMAAQRGGKLGKFSRGNMVKEFSDAAFALKVGQLSDIVETKFGYHVIKRTE